MDQIFLTGTITTKNEKQEQITHALVMRCTADGLNTERVLVAIDTTTQQAISAAKTEKTFTDAKNCNWNNLIANNYMQIIEKCLTAVTKCKILKNGGVSKSSKTKLVTTPTPQGMMMTFSGSVKSYTFEVTRPQVKSVPTYIGINGSDGTTVSLSAINDINLINAYNATINTIPWVVTYEQNKAIEDLRATMTEEEELMLRHVKTMDEVALVKDTTWLKYKKYYVVDSEEIAEQIFSILDNYDGLISYDVESTGLNMNMYCEIGSPLKAQLETYNKNVEPSMRIKADRLTGFSFAIKPDEAYYFPCFHRKFNVLYKDLNNPIAACTANNIKARYTVGDLHTKDNYMAQFIRNTPISEWEPDVILMERCRDIFEKHKILAHHGSFEYKVNMCYGQDLNMVEDTMILHQLAFKWLNVRTHSGEPSNLKFLSKHYLGIDQLSLEDFFENFKEAEQAGEVRVASMTAKKKNKKKKKAMIDFSYMGKEETRCYAPADVDLTLQLWYKFKAQMQKDFPNLDYLYGVEIILACAIGYAEFYGLHINEHKIDNAKYESLITMIEKEHEIRMLNNLCTTEELEAYAEFKSLYNELCPQDKLQPLLEKLQNATIFEDRQKIMSKLISLLADTDNHELIQTRLDKLNNIISVSNSLNLGAPGQVAELLYAKYGWEPDVDGKKSVGKKVIKQYEKLTDDTGNPLYPEVLLYRDWKSSSTLITKFFDKLSDFMYPGGNMFTSFGQIACATGRMSSKKPNFQQLPKGVTKIIEPHQGFVFFDGDFSQIEYRCLCALAHETALIEAFGDPDLDYHTKMASLMFEIAYELVTDAIRKPAKTLNFAIPYGMGFASLAVGLHGNKSRDSIRDAKEKYELYFKDQPNVRVFFAQTKQDARNTGYSETYFGRRRYYKFTDEYNNMSERLIAQALRQAANARIQGTARDIFGIAIARVFQQIRANGLLGKVRINNLIHDEGLYEIDAKINVLAVVGMILEAMQLVIPGFPPLFVGGGVGQSWATAKGGMNEIHPMLGVKMIQEAHEGVMPAEFDGTPESVYKYFDNRVYTFRQEKIADYIAQCEKTLRMQGTLGAINPAIGKLLNLQFTGDAQSIIDDMEKAYKQYCKERNKEPDEEKLKEIYGKIVPLRLKQFMYDFVDKVKAALINTGFTLTDEFSIDKMMLLIYIDSLIGNTYEEDEAYEEYNDEEEIEDDFFDYDFELVDETNNNLFGVSVIDIAKQFGMAVIPSRGVCCIYIGNKTQKQLQALADYFEQHRCEENDDGAMEVQFVRQDNYVLRPGVYVNGITTETVTENLAYAV